MADMSDASVFEPKCNLAHYQPEVRCAGEIQVPGEGASVAGSAPVEARGGGDLAGLIATGLVTAGEGNAARILDEPPLVLPASISEALNDERSGR